MSTGLSIFSRQEVDEQTLHDYGVGQRAAKELLVCCRAFGKSLLKLLEAIMGSACGRDSQEIRAESAVFLAGKMRNLGGRKALECSGKELRLRGRGQVVSQNKILDEKKIAHGRDDGGEKDGYATFALVNQMLESFQRQRKVSLQNGVAQVENAPFASLRHQKPDVS